MRDISGWVVSLPLTNMRDRKDWVVSVVPVLFLSGDIFFEGASIMQMITSGFYVLKDQFFTDMNDPFLKNNKDGNRPFYYCIKGEKEDKNIYWMIPLSHKIEKYRKIIEDKVQANKPCDGLYIAKLPSGTESAFLIQDIFPITDNYIERTYTLGGNHLILPYEDDIDIISQKAKKVLSLIKRGIKLTPTSPNVMAIYDKL